MRKNSGLFLLNENLKALIKWINAEQELNQKEHIKVAKIKSRQTALTLYSVGALTFNQWEFMDEYIKKLVNKETTEADRLKAFEIVEDGIKED